MRKVKRAAALAAAALMCLGGVSYSYAEENELPGDTELESSEPDEDESSYDITDVIYTPEEEQPDAPEESMTSEEPGDPEETADDGQEPTPQPEAAPDDSTDTARPQQEGSSGTTASSEALDVSPYTQKLDELTEMQEVLDRQLIALSDDIENEKERAEAIREKVKTVNEKISVINSYMTRLEFSISANKRGLEAKQQEIDRRIDGYKKRIRALYLAGDNNYLDVLLGSADIYDILMRMDMIERVTEYDNTFIDKLNEEKKQLETIRKQLAAEQADYDSRLAQLNKEKADLDKLLSESDEAKAAMQDQVENLDMQNEAYAAERRSFEEELSDILKSDYGDSDEDKQREAAEAAASVRLSELRSGIDARIENGEIIPKEECRYTFAWPAPGVYYISYGVGARWGRYHHGIDISGDKYDRVVASESGVVLRTNTSCPHDYGKSESCGCGGGYGNYIIIDHGNGFLTLYGHLTEVDVEPGDHVSEGDLIGLMGSTGFSTGDHLHFEIRYNGNYLNPSAFVSIE